MMDKLTGIIINESNQPPQRRFAVVFLPPDCGCSETTKPRLLGEAQWLLVNVLSLVWHLINLYADIYSKLRMFCPFLI
jgi:hypothetical protein